MKTDVISHYDFLIEENNDPVNDPRQLQEYMDKWDGQRLIDSLQLNKNKTVLEIGVGTGRLAIRIAPLCGQFTGIDFSAKTIERAKQHLEKHKNASLICGDFITYRFHTGYDVIYSSLTWMHFQDKQFVIDKTAALLNDAGRFVLSVSKDQADIIDYGTRKIHIYPDDPSLIKCAIKNSGLILVQEMATENAYIFVSEKK